MDAKDINKKIESTIYKVFYNYIPKPIRKISYNIADRFYWHYLKIYSIFYESRIQTYLFDGKEKHSNENITFLISSNDKITIGYIIDLIFSKEVKKKYLGKLSVKKLSKKADEYSERVDALLLQTDVFYINLLKRNKFLIIPRMISMKLDISKPLEDIMTNFNKSLRERVHKVEKDNYSYEIATDIDSFDYFYYNMYLPYSKYRFSDNAVIWRYDSLRAMLQKSFLLFVTYNNERILGIIIYDKGRNKASMEFVGILEGKEDLLKNNLGIACNYFAILLGKEKNIKYLDFGLCRPFLNSGILQHNRQWGVLVEKYKKNCLDRKNWEVIGFKIYKNTKALQSFLLNNPFVYLDEKSLKSIVFVEKYNELTPIEKKRFEKIYFIPNISKLDIKGADDLVKK